MHKDWSTINKSWKIIYERPEYVTVTDQSLSEMPNMHRERCINRATAFRIAASIALQVHIRFRRLHCSRRSPAQEHNKYAFNGCFKHHGYPFGQFARVRTLHPYLYIHTMYCVYKICTSAEKKKPEEVQEYSRRSRPCRSRFSYTHHRSIHPTLVYVHTVSILIEMMRVSIEKLFIVSSFFLLFLFISIYYKKISPPPPPCQESRGGF